MASRVKLKEKEKKQKRKVEKREKKRQRREKIRKNRNKLIAFLLFIIILFLTYSMFIEPNLLNINEYNIKTNEVSDNFHGIKIVHFSDIHYGTLVNENKLKKIVKSINNLEPDIVIFTGDLVDQSYKLTKSDIKILTKELSKIDYNLGKYASLGDEDLNNTDYDNIMYDSEFIVLKNNYDTIYNKDNNPSLIYGLDITPNIDKLGDESIKDIPFKILILHEPDILAKIDIESFDLILGGHSLGGVINLFNKKLFLKDGSKIYNESHYKIGTTNIYISNGIGTNKVPIRFMNVPSINLYRINKIKES